MHILLYDNNFTRRIPAVIVSGVRIREVDIKTLNCCVAQNSNANVTHPSVAARSIDISSVIERKYSKLCEQLEI
jgi:hypothetical protein